MPSRVIRGFDYDAAARRLEVRFTTGRRYLFHDVPPEAAAELRAAFSKGRHFNARIRGRYRFTELPNEPDT
jgi:YD repeat-containing protein